MPISANRFFSTADAIPSLCPNGHAEAGSRLSKTISAVCKRRLHRFSHGGTGDRPRPPPTLRSPVIIRKEDVMAESIYKVIELIGTSTKSWEDAAKNAVETASKSLRDLRVAEITKLDLKIENGKVTAYRARVSLSFKYQKED
jgi:flavin-binding protein dodecin